MSSFCNWDYTLLWARPAQYGKPGILKSYNLNTLLRADMSKAVAGSVDEASFQLIDKDHLIIDKLDPQPMDIMRFSTNSPYSSQQQVIWTGYIDQVTRGFDAQAGDTLVIDASSPWKQWEITSIFLPPPNNLSQISDVASLAIASLQGIGATELIRITANRVGYPGPLGSLQNPAGLHMYNMDAKGNIIPGTDLVAQRSISLPDVYGLPDQPTYDTVLTALATDTGMELFFDEFGSLIFRPLHYLILPPGGPYIISDEDFFQSTFTSSDKNVETRIRVRWQFDYYFGSDGYWPSMPLTQFENTLGVRTRIIQQPWIWSVDSANYVATAIGQMAAAGISGATVTLPANPAIRVGNVILIKNDGVYNYYYVGGIVWSLEWGKAWTMTLQLQYGRGLNMQFPILNTSQSGPILTQAVYSGVAQGMGGLTLVKGAVLPQPFIIKSNSTLDDTHCIGPFPVGTLIQLKSIDKQQPIGTSPNGEYTCQQQTADSVLVVQIKNNENVTQGQVYTVTVSASSSPASQGGASTNNPVVPSSGPSGTGSSAAATSGGTAFSGVTFPFWPLRGYRSVIQSFGSTSDTGEPQGYCQASYFHFGIDIPAPNGTPIFAPCDGTVYSVDGVNSSVHDITGWGITTYINVTGANYRMRFSHMTDDGRSFNRLPLNGAVIGGITVIGFVDSSGNSTGPHLDFGVIDIPYYGMHDGSTIQGPCSLGYVNPIPFFAGAKDPGS